ncbi:GNAT family N-acetyltransferase [Dactylosporangium sp. AC04546]|uniref:GNAT family N-acetyltransferase n=1 Tax=Dactylosporangium sp. AC04546 TaxID=2862460 RepID=UPI001EDE1025|nr:GNAT family N-acetyltransferase [Dactylosporangium sp. AC04546]WVK78459.1 GNAT family N-acetyltransferase [Dactylosporangium sp. AC04546]
MTAIRPAAPADGRGIAEVQRTTWAATYGEWIPDVVAEYDVDASAANWAGAAARPDRHVTVAVDGDRVIGFCASGPDEDRSELGAIHAVYILPEAHGRGIGGRLVADALAWLAERGHGECVLWVAAPNTRSRRFYEHAGFILDEGDGATDTWRGLPVVRYRRPC